jgi:hypothetical protein
MVIVESVTEFQNMVSFVGNRDVLLYPILIDAKIHPAVNTLCILALSCDEELFILPFQHNDAVNLDVSILETLILSGRVYTPSKKKLMHLLPQYTNVIDLNATEYLTLGSVADEYQFLTGCHKKFYRIYDKQLRVNKSVPIMKHIEMIEGYLAHIKPKMYDFNTSDTSFRFINDIAIPALQYLESNGVHVDCVDPKYKRYITDELMYTDYNLFTTTGRPSNKFGGLNFAALNKKDGSRSMFTSRFERGQVVLADYESFHLRLIADMIGYELPTDIAVHEYLGRQYFNKDSLTEDEYEESKQITFRLLYGEERDDNVPDFFKAVYGYVDSLWVIFNNRGYITSPYYNRKFQKSMIENPTPSKLFSYMIQLAETESNLTSILKLKDLFVGKLSKPTLYTYDSILFDYNLEDGTELLTSAISVLSQNSRFPMRVYYGSSYNDVKRLNM